MGWIRELPLKGQGKWDVGGSLSCCKDRTREIIYMENRIFPVSEAELKETMVGGSLESVYTECDHQHVRSDSMCSAGKGLFLHSLHSCWTPISVYLEKPRVIKLTTLCTEQKIICSKNRHLPLNAKVVDSQQSSDKPLESHVARNVIRPTNPSSAMVLQVPPPFIALRLLLLTGVPPVCTILWLWCARTAGSSFCLVKAETLNADHYIAQSSSKSNIDLHMRPSPWPLWPMPFWGGHSGSIR